MEHYRPDFFFQAEDGIRDWSVTGVQTCALPIFRNTGSRFLRHRRVVSVVGIGKCPIPIDDAEIAAIQAAVRSGLPSRPWPFLQIGQRVRVEHGPLCGLEGILLYVKGQRRLVLSVTLPSDQLPSRWTMPGSSPLPNRIEFALNDMCSARGSLL